MPQVTPKEYKRKAGDYGNETYLFYIIYVEGKKE